MSFTGNLLMLCLPLEQSQDKQMPQAVSVKKASVFLEPKDNEEMTVCHNTRGIFPGHLRKASMKKQGPTVPPASLSPSYTRYVWVSFVSQSLEPSRT